MKVIYILSDTMNRRFLQCYGAKEKAVTPNIDRLASRSVVFDNAFTGSMPCMPARRDIMTGRLNFLDRPWGGIEPFDHTLASILTSEKNVYSHMETDHYHYAERGGENYWTHFTSWNLERGTEFDTINWGPDKTGIPKDVAPEGYAGRYSEAYNCSRELYAGDKEQYPTPRTFTAAAQWLEKHHDADNFLLWVEGFDPHEPFDTPPEFVDLYDTPENCENSPFWPDYVPSERYTEDNIAQIRKHYKATVSMVDHYLGKLLNVVDKHDMWKDTLVIFTTDHGFMLGEHGFMGKSYMPDYNEMYNIPFMAAAPGVKPGRSDALVQNIDVFPTVLQWFGIDPEKVCRNKIHGKNLLPLLYGKCDKVRETLLFGCFAKTVNIYDGRYIYMRAPKDQTNEPIHIYGASMAVRNDFIGLESMSDEEIDTIEMGRHLSWTNYPVYKVPANNVHWEKNSLNFQRINRYIDGSKLYDLTTDYEQMHPLDDPEVQQQMIEKLKQAMMEHDAPQEQFIRLGLPEQRKDEFCEKNCIRRL